MGGKFGGFFGGLHAMGVYWGIMGPPNMGGSLGTMRLGLLCIRILCFLKIHVVHKNDPNLPITSPNLIFFNKTSFIR